MPAAAWAFIFQVAAPLGNALITDLMALFHKDKSGTPPTPEDWTALAKKHGFKTADEFLEESLSKLGPK